MKLHLYALVFLTFSQSIYSQYSPAQAALSDYYKIADTLQRQGKYAEAIQYLDSSRLLFGDDSVELAFNFMRRGQCFENLGKMDSAQSNYLKLETISRKINEKEPLSFHLLIKGFNLSRQGDYKASGEALRECLSITDTSQHRGAYRIGFVYKIFAGNYIRQKQLDSAYDAIQKMSFYAELDKDKRLLPQTFNTISWYQYEIGDFESALETAQKEFDFYGMTLDQLNPSNSVLAGNLALNYIQLGDYERAEDYLLAIVEMLKVEGDTNSFNYYANLDNLGDLYVSTFKFDKALQINNEQLKVYKRLYPDYQSNPYYYESLIIKARALAGLGRIDEANMFFGRIVSFYRSSGDEASLMAAHLRAGVAYHQERLFDKALSHLNEALRIQRPFFDQNTKEAIPIYESLAQTYFGMDDLETSLSYLDSALWTNQFKEGYNEQIASKVYSAKWQVEMLNLRLKILKKMWEKNHNPQTLNQALATIQQTEIAVDFARKAIRGDISRLEMSQDFYAYAVYFQIETFEQTKDQGNLYAALSYAENNKSFLLNELLVETSLEKSQEYQKLLDQKKELKQLMLSHGAQGNSSQQLLFYNKLDSIQNKIDDYKSYNHYRKLSEDDLKSIAESSTILSLHVASDYLYCFKYANQELRIKKIPIDSSFNDDILNLRNSLLNPNSDRKKLAFEADLVRFLNDDLEDKLIIAPDGILNYVPFEILNLSEENYLFEKTAITYQNSLFTNIKANNKSQTNLLSFAPEFTTNQTLAMNDNVRSELTSIPGAMKEVSLLADIFKGKSFTQESATETNFLENVRNFGIIHLATHALVDDENPQNSRMVFNVEGDSLNDGYLYAHEISNLNLNAQLATLSACNTGFGQIKKGEGVMSLSRAFAFAGVPATVVSLWPASDKSTPELMKYFYQNLKEGQSKDLALNNARKQYLATAQGKARHPFYWGGFVLIGDNSPIEEDTNLLAYAILSTLILIMILTVYRRRRKSI